jgi:hypothetical protein
MKIPGTENKRNLALSVGSHGYCRADHAPYYLDKDGEVIKR